MSAASATARGQRLAESLMAEQGTVTRVTGSTTSGGREIPVTTTIYTGVGKLAGSTLAGKSAEVVGATVQTQSPQMHFPVGAFVMSTGDLWTFATGTLAGRKYRLAGEAPARSYETAYRVQAEEIL